MSVLEFPIQLLFVLACLFSNPDKNINAINVMKGDKPGATFFVTLDKSANNEEAGSEATGKNVNYNYTAYENIELKGRLFNVKSANGICAIDLMGNKTEYKLSDLALPEVTEGSVVTKEIMGFNISFSNKSGERQIKFKDSEVWTLIK